MFLFGSSMQWDLSVECPDQDFIILFYFFGTVNCSFKYCMQAWWLCSSPVASKLWRQMLVVLSKCCHFQQQNCDHVHIVWLPVEELWAKQFFLSRVIRGTICIQLDLNSLIQVKYSKIYLKYSLNVLHSNEQMNLYFIVFIYIHPYNYKQQHLPTYML